MKKINLLLLIMIAAFGFSIQAQSVHFGAKAGLNLATVTGDETSGLDSRTAFHVGLVAEIGISEKFSFQPELLYSSQGTKESGSEFGASYEDVYKFDYLNIPLMAKYYVADGFSLEAGPQVGFLLSAKDDWKGSYGEVTESGSDDIKDFIKGIDFGLNFGVGYKMESGLNFGARYNLGLSNFWDLPLDIDPEFDAEEFKNQNAVIQLSVGYFF